MVLSRAVEYFSQWGHRKYASRTLEVYVMHMRRFIEFVGDKSVEEVNLFDDVLVYARHLERTGLSDNSINLAMTSLRQLWKALYNLERQLGIRLPFMADMIPVKNLVVARSHKPIKEEEYIALLSAIVASTYSFSLVRARDLAIFSMLYDTGLRISELVALNVSSLDLPRRSAEVVTKKRVDHFKKRETYWTIETHMTLIDYLEKRAEITGSDILFVNIPNRARLSVRSIQRNLKTYLKAAKLDPSGITPHSFRHSVGKRAAASQMYPPLLQNLLGHRNPNSSQIYYNVSNEALRQEYHTKLGDMRPDKVLEHIVDRRGRNNWDNRGGVDVRKSSTDRGS